MIECSNSAFLFSPKKGMVRHLFKWRYRLFSALTGFTLAGSIIFSSNDSFAQAIPQEQSNLGEPSALLSNLRQDQPGMLSRQVVGEDSELMEVSELLGINVTTDSAIAGPGYLTLHDAMNLLLIRNQKIRGDLASLRGAQKSIDKAEAEYFPEVVVSGSLNGIGVLPEDDNDSDDGWNNYMTNSLEVSLQQRLYDFGYREETVNAAKADYERQIASFRSNVEQKMMELVTLYGELRRAILQYRSINEYYSHGLELFKVVKDRTDNDLAPQSELEYVQLQLAETRQQLTQTASRITQARRSFEQEIGIWPKQLAPMPSVAVERISQLADVNLPIKRSAVVIEAQAELDRRRAELASIEAEDKPNVTMEVSGVRNYNTGNSGNTDYTATGTVTMSWTLYDGGRQDIARDQSLLQIKQGVHAVDYLGERAKGDSLRYLIEVKQADRELEIIKGMIASSDQIIRHNVRLFQAGLVSATFMIGSLRERSFYRTRLVDLEHNRAVSSYGYAQAMGILPAQLGIDIQEAIDNYDPATDLPDEQ